MSLVPTCGPCGASRTYSRSRQPLAIACRLLQFRSVAILGHHNKPFSISPPYIPTITETAPDKKFKLPSKQPSQQRKPKLGLPRATANRVPTMRSEPTPPMWGGPVPRQQGAPQGCRPRAGVVRTAVVARCRRRKKRSSRRRRRKRCAVVTRFPALVMLVEFVPALYDGVVLFVCTRSLQSSAKGSATLPTFVIFVGLFPNEPAQPRK